MSTTTTEEPTTAPFWAARSALVMPALLVVLAGVLGYGNSQMQIPGETELFGPRAFPTLVIITLLVVAALLTVSILANPEVPVVPEGAPEGTAAELPSSNWRALAITVGSVALFIMLLETAGWIPAAALLFTGVATGLGSRRYVLNLGTGLAMASIVQLVFVGWLGLTLPAGILAIF